MRVNLYLDVDGVINAVSTGAPRHNTGWMGEWSQRKVGPYPILWAHELIIELNGITGREDVTSKWLTTWEEEAGASLAPAVGLACDGWETLTGARDDSPHDWWKLRQIKADVEASRPDRVVWLDDDIRSERPALEWIQSLAIPVLHISPSPFHGLSRKHIQQVRDFLDGRKP